LCGGQPDAPLLARLLPPQSNLSRHRAWRCPHGTGHCWSEGCFPAAPVVSYVKQTMSVHSSMSSLADAPDLVGFFSYSREDDEGSGGKLSKLGERIQAELRGQLGRANFTLWQDKSIAHGEWWEEEIKSAIARSVFFIPIITPTAVRSRQWKFEFDSFLAREKELGRHDLVFPILYISVPELAHAEWV